jgi:hypothetical protein
MDRSLDIESERDIEQYMDVDRFVLVYRTSERMVRILQVDDMIDHMYGNRMVGGFRRSDHRRLDLGNIGCVSRRGLYRMRKLG